MRYVEGLTSKHSSPALQRGTMIHDLLETWNNGKSWTNRWKELSKEYYEKEIIDERYGDMALMAKELMENYVEYYSDLESEYTILHNELEFEVFLCTGKNEKGKDVDIYLKGFIDNIFRDKHGKVFIRDYKTYSFMPNYDFFVFNFQSAIYQWAVREGFTATNGEYIQYEPSGMVWDVITAKMPSSPQVLKNGELSQRKIASTPYTVAKAIEAEGLDISDYQDLIEKHSFEDFFQRYLIRYNKKSIMFMIKDLMTTARQISRYQTKFMDFNLNTKYRSSYMDLWQCYVTGGDIEFLISKNYDRKEVPSDQGKEKVKRKKKKGTRHKRK